MSASRKSRPQGTKSTKSSLPPPAYNKTPKSEKSNLDEFYAMDRWDMWHRKGKSKNNVQSQDNRIRRGKVEHDEALINRCIWRTIGRRLGIEYPELPSSASKAHDDHHLTYLATMVSLFIDNFEGRDMNIAVKRYGRTASDTSFSNRFTEWGH